MNNFDQKRILLLNYEFPPLGGGASPVSYEIAKGYIEFGHQVDVVTMGFKGLPIFEQKDGINIYRVKCLRSKKELCHPWEQVTYLIFGWLKCKELCKKNKYDICHCHFIIPTGILALKLKKKFALPYIITSHGSDVLGYNPRFRYLYLLLKRKWQHIILEAELTVVPSKFLQTEIKKIIPQARISLVPNSIDLKRFRPLTKENRILLVARLFKNKGMQDVFEALRPLANDLKLNGWKVDVVGDGPDRKFLEDKARNCDLTSIIEFHGWIDNNSEALEKIYGRAKIFVSASRFESFGLAVLEAMSSGCYCLVSDIAGHRQLNLDYEHYFSLGDVYNLTTKIKTIIAGGNLTDSNVAISDAFSNFAAVKKYINILWKNSKINC